MNMEEMMPSCPTGEADMGGTNALPELTRQAEEKSGDRKEMAADAGEPQTKETREERFRELMEGEYKDLFTAYFQETFNRRFKQQKGMKEELLRAREVVEAAAARFGIQDVGELAAAIRAEQERYEASMEAEAPPTSPPEGEHDDVQAMIERAVADAVARAREETERAVLDSIRARGMRPTENALTPGISHRGGGAARLSRAERAEMAQRAARGERIEL